MLLVGLLCIGLLPTAMRVGNSLTLSMTITMTFSMIISITVITTYLEAGLCDGVCMSCGCGEVVKLLGVCAHCASCMYV